MWRSKDLIYETINNVNPLYLTINKMNGCIQENNGNKYLVLILLMKTKTE